MFKSAKLFRRDESGAITVDWVVFTAGAVALALGATTLIADGTEEATDILSTTIAERPVGN